MPEEIPDADHELVMERVCAIDVAKASGVVCVRTPREHRRVSKVWDVESTTGAVSDLAGQLMELGVEKVTVESTSDYWRIWYYLLEAARLDVQLVNARDVKNVPGRPKTDAEDAAVIADQARMRRDLQPLRPEDDIAVELRILTSRRTDLVTDRTRAINRLRAQLLEYFPALERAFDYSASKAALILLTGYQTPEGLRHAGAARLAAWLRKRKARNADAVAAAAIEAAKSQHTVVPGQQMAAAMVARLAEEVMTLNTEIGDTDAMIEERFRRHRHAEIILSMPGFGVILGAEFLAATGGDIAAFGNTDRLAAVAGLAPVPRDSGRISGNLKRPRRYNRRLLRACYLASHNAIRTDTASRIYYDRKRAQGKRHTQAVLALARRRLNVMWAMLRDHKPYQPTAPNAAAA
ncbi:MAG TPA: IS110 family transposase [Mycobacterium sp.]|nr:IS110 family transposase [Mycobacterium sp.]